MTEIGKNFSSTMGLLLLLLAACAMAVDPQVAAMRGLLARVIPEHARFFQVQLVSAHGQDVWEVETVGQATVLRGTSGVALASAFNWFLKYKCNSVYLWQEQQLSLPTPLPAVSPKERRQTAFSYRYYYNVCTMGYTTG
jgi:alpha-N-acetylglucosaminidase